MQKERQTNPQPLVTKTNPIMSSSAANAATAQMKVLSTPSQWDDWMDQTSTFMEQNGLWKFMNIERVLGADEHLPNEPIEPIMPELDEIAAARAASPRTTTQEHVLTRADYFRTMAATYDSFARKKEKAIKYFNTYVDARWQHVMRGCPTLHSTMRSLEQHIAPKLETRRNALRNKHQMLQRGKPANVSMTTHLYQWSLLERRMEAYDMADRHALQYGFSRSIAAYNESVYNMIRSAGDIARDELPPLATMIQIVRAEVTARNLPDSTEAGRTANATYQDTSDTTTGDQRPSPSTDNSNSEKRESSTAREKKNPKNKREKRGGCGFVTKKPIHKQCASLQECDVANGQLWPDEQDRTAEWKKALKSYKQYCKDNKSFCERSANTFKNPAAIEVWQQHHCDDWLRLGVDISWQGDDVPG